TFSKLQIWAIGSVSRGDQSGHSGSSRTVPISPEGVFQVTGLPAGETRILLLLPKDLPGIVISRIDHPMVQMAVREGREPEGAVTLQPGDQISGIRIILKRLAGGIRGAIKLAGGNLSPGAYLNVTLWRPSGSPGSESGNDVKVDGNGRFDIRGLAAGQYRLTAQIIVRNQSGPPDLRMRAEKRFTIADSVEEIEMEIDVRKRDQ
ncbi:MAG TPA: carboxypeptidase-like regulatory domain-containing protein, partial [Blastocatellia bacterium]|nr:carboxypeptidase-like regulatory domain-containing protein [Blastocatellia bacterium]